MHKLIIKNADGSTYWKAEFNSRAELDKWLDEEKTRKYWKKEFTVEILDQTPVKDPVEEANKAKDQLDRHNRLKSIDWSKVNSLAEIKAVLKDLVDNT